MTFSFLSPIDFLHNLKERLCSDGSNLQIWGYPSWTTRLERGLCKKSNRF